MASARPAPGTPLWLRGLRSRPLVNALLLVLAGVAVATAVLGPLLVRAVHQYTVQSGIAAAPRSETSIVLSVAAEGDTPEALATAYGTQSDLLGGVLRYAVRRSGSAAWQPPEVTVVSSGNLAWSPGTKPGKTVSSRINAVEPGCAGYVLTAGRCPADLGEVVVSAPDAERAGLAPDQVLTMPQTLVGRQQLRVVGRYDPTASDRGQLIRPGTPAGGLAAVTAEPLLVSSLQASGLLLPAEVSGRLALGPTVTVADLPAIRATVDQVGIGVLDQPVLVELQTAVPRLLDRIDGQARAAGILMAVTVAQAVGLALFATAIVLQRVARTRAAEWGIGRLRGVGRARWLASVYVEPGLVLLAGLPLGYGLGAGIASLAVTRYLGPETPLELTRWPVLTVAALTAVGALAALVAVSLRSLRRPLPELISSATEPRRLTVLGAMAQTAVVLLAAASLYQLLAGGALVRERSLLGLLAPGLFALALAVFAVRAAVVVVRRVTTRPPRSLTALVVGRQTARTPSTLNPAIVLASGLALAVFAAQVLVLADRNADLRAAAITGADQVLEVAVPPETDLLEAVRAADPSGQWAMAVQERRGGAAAGTSRIIAVDSARLAAVAAWSPQWAEVADVGAALRTATAPPVEIRGTRVELSVTGSRVIASSGVNPGSGTVDPDAQTFPPSLQLTVDDGKAWRTVDFGSVPEGSARLRGPIPCAEGCRVVSLGTSSAIGTAYDVAFTLTGVGTDQQPAADSGPWLTGPGRWREVVGRQTSLQMTNGASATAREDGLRVVFNDDEGGRATLVAPADTDDPLPALVSPRVSVVTFPGSQDVGNGTGMDGRSQLIRVVGRAAVLPRSLDDGVLVDLVNARGLVDPSTSDGANQVWLRAGAPDSVEQGLAAAGLRVQSRELLADTATDLRQQAVPRAALLSLLIAGVGLALALLTLVAVRVADGSRRRRDWFALRQAGLSTRTLRRLAFVEIAAPALIGTAIGLLAGQAAIRLAAAKLPLVDPAAPGPPLDLRLGWLPVGLLALALAVLVVLVAAVSAAIEARTRSER